MVRKIKLAGPLPRINIPVVMTKKCQAMFPRPHTGILVRKAMDGRYVIRREGRTATEYWHPSLWRKQQHLKGEGEAAMDQRYHVIDTS